MGRENVKNIQKTNQICYCFYFGGDLKLRGDFPSLKALNKTLSPSMSHSPFFFPHLSLILNDFDQVMVRSGACL